MLGPCQGFSRPQVSKNCRFYYLLRPRFQGTGYSPQITTKTAEKGPHNLGLGPYSAFSAKPLNFTQSHTFRQSITLQGHCGPVVHDAPLTKTSFRTKEKPWTVARRLFAPCWWLQSSAFRHHRSRHRRSWHRANRHRPNRQGFAGGPKSKPPKQRLVKRDGLSWYISGPPRAPLADGWNMLFSISQPWGERSSHNLSRSS